MRSLTNGTTVHGLSSRARPFERIPTPYYGRATGVGLALTSRPHKGRIQDRRDRARASARSPPTGAKATRCASTKSTRSSSSSPVRAATSPSSKIRRRTSTSWSATLDLSLEDEQARGERQDFDILILDAFSSDAIPIHLMTREAFEDYFEALAPDGMMAVHVSNRHFHLMNLVSRMAAEFGAHSLQIKTAAAPKLQSGLDRLGHRLARRRRLDASEDPHRQASPESRARARSDLDAVRLRRPNSTPSRSGPTTTATS